MKNITISNFDSRDLLGLTAVDVFCTSGSNIFIYGNGKVVQFKETFECITLCNICDVYPLDDPTCPPNAVQISYSRIKDTLFVCLEDGVIISIELFGSRTADVVGSIDNGISAVAWSPGEETVVFITGNNSVIIMNNEFDPVSETPLHGQDFGESQFVTVGWGKKETQFRGTEGKLSIKGSAHQEEGLAHDDSKVRISWRGDAKYFAVSCINPVDGKRYIRVFGNEGVLQYTSENIPGLESSLAWQPSGSLIAATQRQPNKHLVIFIEKNGLAHGNFALPFQHDEMQVQELKWSCDSKLLAVYLESVKSASKFIQIYTMKNYHWYCKYSIDVSKSQRVMLLWDEVKGTTLHIAHGVDHFKFDTYTWLWTVNKSKGMDHEDEALVAVIDGSKVLVTSFRSGITPPPMSTYAIQLPLAVNAVGFASPTKDLNSNDMFVQLSDGQVFLYKFKKTSASCEGKKQRLILNHELVGQFSFPKDDFIFNLQWFKANYFLYCARKTAKLFFSLAKLTMENSLITVDEVEISCAVLALFPDTCHVLVNTSDGSFYVFTVSDDQIQATDFYNDILPTGKHNLHDVEIVKQQNETCQIFSLDKNNKLYINDKLAANNITSIAVHEEFLLLTSSKHELLCLNTETISNNVENALKNVTKRNMERGSRIIRTIPKDTKVILQMPRGNLECIQPRALSFSIIAKCLDALEYEKAFLIMRKERINLNLLYDHNPQLFTNHVSTFIDQITDPAWISLFLSDLAAEDVTCTMYAMFYKVTTNKPMDNKVDIVCSLMEKALLAKPNTDKYLLPVLTTYIKRGTLQHIESALLIIKGVKEQEQQGERPVVSADAALKYVLYLSPVEQLFDVALGLYDFDLVLMIAEKSQKDPKEYIPLLNQLRKLDTNYQHFTIDKKLKRYSKALESLILCDTEFQECVMFIQEHSLYKAALKLVSNHSNKFKLISSHYGEDLMKNGFYEEAGVVFTQSDNWSKALKAFQKSTRWEEVLYCASKLEMPESELVSIYKSLAGQLVTNKKFKEAATVYLEYLNDFSGYLEALLAGHCFSEALRVARHRDQSNMIESTIKPAVLNCYDQLKEQISSSHALLDKQNTRLGVVRELKKRVEELDAPHSEQDMFSETSTVITQSQTGTHTSGRSFRSSKNRRKQERKLLSLKEGSPHEDLALVTSLHGMVTTSWALRPQVLEVNRCLLTLGHEERAEELQRLLGQLLKDIDRWKTDIWNMEVLRSSQNSFGPEATSNSIAAMYQRQDGQMTTSLLTPALVFPPTFQPFQWQLQSLK